MTTSTALGPNSVEIAYTPSDTYADISAAIQTFLTAHGWTVFETIDAESVVYAAPYDDNARDKFVKVTTNPRINTEHYEYWDTGIGTNVSYQSDSTAATYTSALDLVIGGYVYVFATVHYMFFFTRHGSGTYGKHGVFEAYQLNETIPLTSACSKSFFVTHQQLMTQATQQQASVPKSLFGVTGNSAAGQVYVNTPIGGNGYSISLGSRLPAFSDPFTNKPYVFPLYVSYRDSFGSDHPVMVGEFYGIKALSNNIGAEMDTIDIPVDANGLYDAAGTLTEHMIVVYSIYRLAIPL